MLWTLAACIALRFTPALGTAAGSAPAAGLIIPLAGVVLAVIPIPRGVRYSRDVQRGLHWAGVLVQMLFVVASAAPIGLFFLPSTIASFFAEP